MTHVPGHRDDNNIYGGGMPAVPAQPYNPPPFSPSQIWANTQPRNIATQNLLNPSTQENPSIKYLKTLQYDVTPYGASPRKTFTRDGLLHAWNPKSGMYEVVSNPGTGTSQRTGGGGMGGVNTNFSKITNADQQQRQALRTQYMMGLSPIQEGIRQARVGGTQSSDLLRSQLAQTAIGGFGGISGAAEQRVLDTARGQEGQYIEQKANLYTDYLSNLLGVDKQTADAIAKEAVKRASKLAGAEKAYLQSEAEKLMATYAGIGGK